MEVMFRSCWFDKGMPKFFIDIQISARGHRKKVNQSFCDLYLDLAHWGPPPWNELQWATLRNVIELAKNS